MDYPRHTGYTVNVMTLNKLVTDFLKSQYVDCMECVNACPYGKNI